MSDPVDQLTAALAGRYHIERELGAGGMATVYLAEDLKHDRKVALKVLRPELAAVLGADRFIQEIKTTANLQHPHILPLFDSGEADSFLYYVMPFIDGETLRNKLDRETQLSIDEAVKITTEIADALDYAHRQGVIHRDIKPENILLHDGRPMVADFGIALAVSAAAGGRMTETGMSLGTPHYMSPEQATADKDLTNRSDIYSLGSVLYEMLTGEPPHTGASAQAIVMKIMTEDAQPVSELRGSVPSNVAAATSKSLERLAADRFATAKEFAAALTNPAFSLPSRGVTRVDAAVNLRWKRMSFASTAVAALLLVATVWGWLRQPATSPTPVTRLGVSPLYVSNEAPPFCDLTLSQDGSRIVFGVAPGGADDPGLYLKRRDQFDAVLIRGTEGATSCFFSPDGEWVGFWADGALRKVPVDGGPVVTIAITPPVWSAVWGPNEQIVFSELLSGLRIVSANGGTVETLTRIGHETLTDLGHYGPDVLPGGDNVLFTSFDGASSRIAVASIETGEWRILIDDAVGAHYTPTGHLVFARTDGSLWAAPFDLERPQLKDEARLVMDRAIRVDPQYGRAYYAIADEGTLLFAASGQTTGGDLVWVDRAGEATALPFPPAHYVHPRLSPDGNRIAVPIQEPSEGREAIWLLDLEHGTRARFTIDGPANRWPVWTHAGSRIAFVSSRGGSTWDLYWKPVDGGGDAEPLLVGERLVAPFSWSDVRHSLAYYEFGTAQADIWVLPDGGEPALVDSSPFDTRAPMISPDGRWLAYVSNESGEDQVYVRPYPGPGAAISVSTTGGNEPMWSRDGRELYFRHADEMLLVRVGSNGNPGSPSLLFRQPYSSGPIGRGNPNYDVTPDGGFLMVRDRADESSVYMVLNFFAELRTRLEFDKP